MEAPGVEANSFWPRDAVHGTLRSAPQVLLLPCEGTSVKPHYESWQVELVNDVLPQGANLLLVPIFVKPSASTLPLHAISAKRGTERCMPCAGIQISKFHVQKKRKRGPKSIIHRPRNPGEVSTRSTGPMPPKGSLGDGTAPAFPPAGNKAADRSLSNSHLAWQVQEQLTSVG